jgi:antitoxin HicB
MTSAKPIIGFRIEIFVEPDEPGFHAYCPALKGLHVGGDTEEEALENAKDAAIAYLQSLMKHGDPIPVGIAVCGETGQPSYPSENRTIRHTENLKVACAI